jgi:60 kDa SS-A/Ro ribonucleoprotein
MASKSLFKGFRGRRVPAADAVNEAGGTAYRLEPAHALAQYAVTGCLNGTFYTTGEMQLDGVLKLCDAVPAEFVARVAVYARRKAHMKDLPSLLCAVLSIKAPGLLADVFDSVIDSPRTLRNFVQIMRSGAIGRKSLGSLPKRLILRWLERRSDEQVFIGSVGNDPSMADIVKMVHPKPASASRAALYGYLIGRDHDAEALPERVKAFEAFKRIAPHGKGEPPDVPMQMLTALPLTKAHWCRIATRSPWQATRMNLNTFARHGVFEDMRVTGLVYDRLRDADLIGKARAFPYQLMAAYVHATEGIPGSIREALQDAMEIATRNVPKVDGKVFVLPDISGSMQSPVTGYRKGSSTAVRCVDVAALVAATMLRTNPATEVVPFHDVAIAPERAGLNPRDSVMTNANRLASLPSGGTDCSAPLMMLNERKAVGDLVIYVSDNESWVDSRRKGRRDGTATMRAWSAFKQRNPAARMICIDIQPYGTAQSQDRDDITNVGGFSDDVFNLIAAVARGETAAGHWVRQIESIEL